MRNFWDILYNCLSVYFNACVCVLLKRLTTVMCARDPLLSGLVLRLLFRFLPRPPRKTCTNFGKYFVKNWDTNDNILFFQALWLGCNISPPPPIFAFPHKHNLHSQQNKVNLGRVDHPEPRLPGPKLHPEDFESDAAGLSDCCSVNARNFPSVAAWQPPRWEGRNSANVLLDLGGKEIFASYGP